MHRARRVPLQVNVYLARRSVMHAATGKLTKRVFFVLRFKSCALFSLTENFVTYATGRCASLNARQSATYIFTPKFFSARHL